MTVQDVRSRRISRELFLAAVGVNLGVLEPWVTDRLTAVLEEEEAAPGDRLFGPGEPPDYIYFLRRGHLALVGAGAAEELVDAPRAVGMLDALVARPRTLSAYARSPLELLRVRADAWFELLEDSFELARMSVLGLARVVADLEERIWANGSSLLSPALITPELEPGPLDIVERVSLLMGVPLLGGAGVRPVSDLAAACDERAFVSGQPLFERGTARDRLFVLIDGQVVAHGAGSRSSWRGGAGQMACGTVPLGATGPDWEARAVTPTRALAFRLDDWFDVMEENFEMVRATLATLALARERYVCAGAQK